MIAPAAAVAVALLLTGCDDDDGGSGPGIGGLSSGGLGEDGGAELPDIGDLELETTGGFGEGEDGPPPVEANEDWLARWESGGITLYTTTDGVLYGNAGTGEVCTGSGIMGGLDWEPALLSCTDAPKNATFRLNGDSIAVEWSDRTEELTRAESLAGQTVDLTALESTILN
ncbi:hypothetical protein RM844_13635 [Streptomyces sp. DSM 44915]|uniref:META domain-containing protein n=1 Tax=Streptomyces chisholmiae TaxID=3075540 RepID=A0ABU2JQR2_9ACTN|nr:hypothetical protein [Streptomyces sp. DSM 44915]MDT0267327.1 hypothetical protein [Streptomyces sp. DSM 44915]